MGIGGSSNLRSQSTDKQSSQFISKLDSKAHALQVQSSQDDSGMIPKGLATSQTPAMSKNVQNQFKKL
jgi:hypothetical protein